MTRLLQILHALVLVALMAILGMAGLFFWNNWNTTSTTLRDFHVTVLEAGLTLKNIREATAEWKKASQAQAAESTAILSASKGALDRIQTLVARTDFNLNDALIPQLSADLKQQNEALLEGQAKLRGNLDQMQQATVQLQTTLASANAVIADPAIKQSILNLEKATEQTTVAVTHLAGITDAGEQTARYYQKKLTTPQGFFKTLLQFVLDAGSKARVLFVGAN